MKAIREQPQLELQVVTAGTMVLERFDKPARVVERRRVSGRRRDLTSSSRVRKPITMAKSRRVRRHRVRERVPAAPARTLSCSSAIATRRSAAAIAAAYMNITIVHVQGGEVSGSIDESARHAITKFAHFHFPVDRTIADVHLFAWANGRTRFSGIGCPSSDMARTFDRSMSQEDCQRARIRGDDRRHEAVPAGACFIRPRRSSAARGRQMRSAASARSTSSRCRRCCCGPTSTRVPTTSASRSASFGPSCDAVWLRTLTNLAPEHYLKVLANAACAVGNSSSFVRDASFFGTPVVLVGNRQNCSGDGRPRGPRGP